MRTILLAALAAAACGAPCPGPETSKVVYLGADGGMLSDGGVADADVTDPANGRLTDQACKRLCPSSGMPIYYCDYDKKTLGLFCDYTLGTNCKPDN
jgi:hypothetical protein